MEGQPKSRMSILEKAKTCQLGNLGFMFEINTKLGYRVWISKTWYSIGKNLLLLHSVVNFHSWAIFSNSRCKKGNEGVRDLREDCCEYSSLSNKRPGSLEESSLTFSSGMGVPVGVDILACNG